MVDEVDWAQMNVSMNNQGQANQIWTNMFGRMSQQEIARTFFNTRTNSIMGVISTNIQSIFERHKIIPGEFELRKIVERRKIFESWHSPEAGRISKELSSKVMDICGKSGNITHISDEIRKIMDEVSKWK